MAQRNHERNGIMSLWLKTGAALSVLLTLSAIVGSVLLVKFRVDVLEGDVSDLKTEFRAMQKILVDLDKTMTVGFNRLETRIDPMIAAVANAQQVSEGTKARVQENMVKTDDALSQMRDDIRQVRDANLPQLRGK